MGLFNKKPTPQQLHLDELEAKARRLMTAIASMPRRGWDHEAERSLRIVELDVVLDEWNTNRAQTR